MNNTSKIHYFTDLDAWKTAHELVLLIYEITKSFPKEEMFGLTNQVRRACVSTTSNIAEGFSRNSYKEKLQFYSMALGSLTEVQSQIMIARDLTFISTTDYSNIEQQTIIVHKLLNGLIKSSKTIILNS